MKLDELFHRKRQTWNGLLRLRKDGRGMRGRAQTVRCPRCNAVLPAEELEGSLWLCPECRGCLPMPAEERIALVADPGSFRELFPGLKTRNPLSFPGYEESLSKSRDVTGEASAFLAGVCRIDGEKAAVGVLDGRFLMGSMGTAEGEKIARLAEYAAGHRIPLVIFSASGGARMQEGLFSLLQMAKTSAAVGRFRDAGGLFVSVLLHPATGGVSASYASLGDIILAEPDALIGFAGPRVIRQTIGETLPEGFQHAEFQLEHGMVDRIVERSELKTTLAAILRLHRPGALKTGAGRRKEPRGDARRH